ncbi:hypothetical protein [Aeromicrobium sp. UC242_57]|uniref:hypothetical protein n=1 Tax=Aeromicrobium sp. UC242_57 TaxID=3374624 RepID=UPI0037A556E2
MWVRDDGKIELTDPEVTIVFMVVGVLVFFGLGVLVFLSVRTNVRKVDEQLAAPPPAP